MANSDRRKNYTDSGDNMFIPMNVEGGMWDGRFMTTTKTITIVGFIAALVILVASLNSSDFVSLKTYVVYIGIWAIAFITALRYIVFEEKFYYRMYKELSKHEITTPSIFWDISSIKDTDDGAILTYSDAKVGIMVRVNRDTITGKEEDFSEIHYDAISDFYRDIVNNRYSFIQMNIMEQAGKDSRLNELTKLIDKSDNHNICKLMELQIGHIKNTTHRTLYESDYFLFYTDNINKVDSIIQDISESLFNLLDGGYESFSILDKKGVVDLLKEIYGVNYFNATEASLNIFSNESYAGDKPFNITGIVWSNGHKQELNTSEVNKLRKRTSEKLTNTDDTEELSLKTTFYVDNKNKNKKIKDNLGIKYEDIQ